MPPASIRVTKCSIPPIVRGPSASRDAVSILYADARRSAQPISLVLAIKPMARRRARRRASYGSVFLVDDPKRAQSLPAPRPESNTLFARLGSPGCGRTGPTRRRLPCGSSSWCATRWPIRGAYSSGRETTECTTSTWTRTRTRTTQPWGSGGHTSAGSSGKRCVSRALPEAVLEQALLQWACVIESQQNAIFGLDESVGYDDRCWMLQQF